jgi:DNA primase
MSLPPGFMDELRSRVSIAQVAGRKVMWDNRKSNQAKGDMWAPCPFHQEKTASFHVDDRKGFYYCFGCHAKGDAIKFVQETENVAFMEAVEILAGEVGMQMPARDPKAAEKADRNTELAKATEAAVAHFRLKLKTQAGTEARAYLTRRGLEADMLDRFEIGFAPDAWQGLWDALKAKGFADDVLLDAGLAKPSQKGGKPYDTFRGRIMFPIRDPRGRCIAFGGRAMDPDAGAKYLNSPETALFDKGRTLFNHGPAREAAGKGHALIVAEGYMDVIALVRAGFEAAVAPLGTAITEDQLRLLWRIADEPIIALDGDRAGLAAAMRLVDLALPMLQPGKTLRFCLMPEGQDPDDLIKAKGRAAMQARLEAAVPLVQILWRRETEGQVFDSPERRAALDRRLRAAIATIPDASLKHHYGEALRELRRQLFRPASAPPGGGGQGRGARRRGAGAGSGRFGYGFAEAQTPLAETRASALGSGAFDAADLRCALILAVLARYPALAPEHEADLDRLEPSHPDHAALADALLATRAETAADFAAECAENGLATTLDLLRNLPHLRINPILAGTEDAVRAARCLREEFDKHHAARAVEAELSEAMQDLETVPETDTSLASRLRHAVHLRHHAGRPHGEADNADATADDRAAAAEGLRALIDARAWEKKSR